jgi:D-alanine-D-alanine ligase
MAARPPVETMLASLRATEPDLVFNLIEGFWGSGAGATLVTGMIELAGLAYTGCPSDALCWCLSKSRAKALLRGLGLPTAPFLVVAPEAPVPEWAGPWPAFVKPDAEDASLGIDQRSVAADQAALGAQVALVRGRYGSDVLIEAYLPGPEFNVGLLGLPDPEPLPIAEVVYQPSPGSWPILTYDAKWVAGSPADLASPVRCPALIDTALASALGRLAVDAFRATGCRDYARVDFRLDEHGEPMILEVNPNPDLGPTSGWARALESSGRDYGATLAAVARTAIARGPAFGRALNEN